MSIPTDENRDLLTVVATMRAQSGQESELRAVLEGLVAPTREENGNVAYALHQAPNDPAIFYFYEVWETQADLEAHLGGPGVQAALGRLGELVDGEVVIQPLFRIA